MQCVNASCHPVTADHAPAVAAAVDDDASTGLLSLTAHTSLRNNITD